eukprot:TRINITY_DN45761_c0_g1_i1.p1 TRINITY_DN45761_c0_g1~~TRINITY_DN45761_c0_g1_i1.p1  ORF type:complete len:668 (-),score=134.20 TRINITY_DN45761_c0_g1_i1:168-1940(-)
MASSFASTMWSMNPFSTNLACWERDKGVATSKNFTVPLGEMSSTGRWRSRPQNTRPSEVVADDHAEQPEPVRETSGGRRWRSRLSLLNTRPAEVAEEPVFPAPEEADDARTEEAEEKTACGEEDTIAEEPVPDGNESCAGSSSAASEDAGRPPRSPSCSSLGSYEFGGPERYAVSNHSSAHCSDAESDPGMVVDIEDMYDFDADAIAALASQGGGVAELKDAFRESYADALEKSLARHWSTCSTPRPMGETLSARMTPQNLHSGTATPACVEAAAAGSLGVEDCGAVAKALASKLQNSEAPKHSMRCSMPTDFRSSTSRREIRGEESRPELGPESPREDEVAARLRCALTDLKSCRRQSLQARRSSVHASRPSGVGVDKRATRLSSAVGAPVAERARRLSAPASGPWGGACTEEVSEKVELINRAMTLARREHRESIARAMSWLEASRSSSKAAAAAAEADAAAGEAPAAAAEGYTVETRIQEALRAAADVCFGEPPRHSQLPPLPPGAPRHSVSRRGSCGGRRSPAKPRLSEAAQRVLRSRTPPPEESDRGQGRRGDTSASPRGRPPALPPPPRRQVRPRPPLPPAPAS